MTIPLHQPLVRWGAALALWFLSTFILLGIKRMLVRWFSRKRPSTNARFRPEALQVTQSINPLFLWAIGFAIGIPLAPAHWGHAIKVALILGASVQVLITGSSLINPLTGSLLFRRGEQQEDQTAQNALNILLRVLLWVLVILLSLENLGVKISTLVAGLGVGGIAAGLALQHVASDLFASVAIMWDKPFQIGDFITIDTLSGTVERVGIKTTRIRSITGEELIFPNTDLVTGRIHNFRRMEERRIVFSIGATYDTSVENLRAIPSIIQKVIANLPQVRFDRAHFKDFGPSSLDFEIVYFILTAEYTIYMDIQQTINLALIDAFQQRGIEFAFPTQTIILASGAPLKSRAAMHD